jgi:hypothetical protein
MYFLNRFLCATLTFSQVYSVKGYYAKAGFAPAAGARNFVSPYLAYSDW